MKRSTSTLVLAAAFMAGLLVVTLLTETSHGQRGGRGGGGAKATGGQRGGGSGNARRQSTPSRQNVANAAKGRARNAIQNRGKQAIGNKARAKGYQKSDLRGNPQAQSKLKNAVKNKAIDRTKNNVRNRLQNNVQRRTQQGPTNPGAIGNSPVLNHLDEIRNHVGGQGNGVIKDKIKDKVKDHVRNNVKNHVKGHIHNNVKNVVKNNVGININKRNHWHGGQGYNRNTYIQVCDRAKYLRKNFKLHWGFATWKTYYPTRCHWWYNYCGPKFYFDPTCSVSYDWTYYSVPTTVIGQVVNPEIRWYMGMKCALIPGKGLGIEEVTSGSPAELAGLAPGMFILAANGIVIEGEASMPIAIDQSGGLLGLDVLVSEESEVVRVDVTLQPVAVSRY